METYTQIKIIILHEELILSQHQSLIRIKIFENFEKLDNESWFQKLALARKELLNMIFLL